MGLAANYRDILQTIFRNKLTNDEVKEINKGRQTKTKINEGILSDNEKENLTKGKKLQTVLATTLPRMCKITIKPEGNDVQDAKLLEDALDISIHIYNSESRQIYKSSTRPVTVNIFMTENHSDVISNIAAFTCANDPNKKANQKCELCKALTKCNSSQQTVECVTCHKLFYGQQCLNKHIKNKKCIEHSYKCEKCHRFYKTADLKMADHKCDYDYKKLFKIEKFREYRDEKFQAVRSEWKISGPVDLFQVNNVITKLVDEMTANSSDNVKLQVSSVSNVDDKINRTKLLNKNEIVNELSDWVHFFIDYHDM